MFSEIVEADGVDAARRILADELDSRTAAELAAYWCAPPPDSGCEGSDVGRAWKLFERGLAETDDDAQARTRVAGAFDVALASAIHEYWSPAEVGDGLEVVDGRYEQALDTFAALVEAADEPNAEDARRVVADEFGESLATDIYEYWCSPPAYPGCTDDQDSYELALDRFGALVDDGNLTAEDARRVVAEQFGESLANELHEYWCSPPAFAGCGQPPFDCEVPYDEASDFETLTVSCTWHEEGTYFVALDIRDRDDELLDYSSPHRVVVSDGTDGADSTAKTSKDTPEAAVDTTNLVGLHMLTTG